MSISSLNTINPASLLIPVANTASTTGSSTASPVVQSSDPGLAAQASALSATSGIVATLGSSNGVTAQVYDAAGLYNSIAQAGTSAAASSTGGGNESSAAAAAASAQQALNSAILSTLPGGSYSGFYDGTGVVQSASSAGGVNLTSNWASALQSNPNLSRTVAADSFAQGIIGTLSTTA
ncbi:MAG TPA: hypothetical protein VF798_10285 [Burkholderiaceae bacterium]